MASPTIIDDYSKGFLSRESAVEMLRDWLFYTTEEADELLNEADREKIKARPINTTKLKL